MKKRNSIKTRLENLSEEEKQEAKKNILNLYQFFLKTRKKTAKNTKK